MGNKTIKQTQLFNSKFIFPFFFFVVDKVFCTHQISIAMMRWLLWSKSGSTEEQQNQTEDNQQHDTLTQDAQQEADGTQPSSDGTDSTSDTQQESQNAKTEPLPAFGPLQLGEDYLGRCRAVVTGLTLFISAPVKYHVQEHFDEHNENGCLNETTKNLVQSVGILFLFPFHLHFFSFFLSLFSFYLIFFFLFFSLFFI